MKIRHHKDAQAIVEKFKTLGKRFGMKVVGLITQTKEPAGNGVGPCLEAIDVLKVLEQRPDRPLQLEERALHLAGQLLDLCYADAGIRKSGKEEAARILREGTALTKFKQIVQAQGGNPKITSQTFPLRSKTHAVRATHSGTVRAVNNFNLNSIAKLLGAPKDRQAGLYLHKKVGDRVEKGETVITFHANSKYHLAEAQDTLKMFPIFIID